MSMKKVLVSLCCVSAMFLISARAHGQRCPDPDGRVRIRVKPGNPSSPDGCSWATAFPSVQGALDVARAGDEVWVAHGLYTPEVPNDPDPRAVCFAIAAHVYIYGGLAGNETPATFDPSNDVDYRDFIANETIMSGELGDPGTPDDNAYTVISDTTGGAFGYLDGFTIIGACEHAMICDSSGPELRNLHVTANQSSSNGAGALHINSSRPSYKNCTFANNTSSYYGGAVYCESGSDAIFENVAFYRNTAPYGGAMYIDGSDVQMAGCTFAENFSTSSGGAIYSTESAPALRRCSLDRNTAGGYGGAISCDSYTPSQTLILIRCTFNDNLATGGRGGAVAIGRNSARLFHCTFQGNTAWDHGGTSTSTGGAVASGFSMGAVGDNLLDIVNCLFIDNHAYSGGGLYILRAHSGDSRIVNSTFGRNGASDQGGGVFFAYSYGQTAQPVYNSIFWGNTAANADTVEHAQITYTNVQPPVDHTCVQGLSDFNGNDNIGSDPQFVAPSQGNYRLRSGSNPSLCIGAGDDDSVAQDEFNVADLNPAPPTTDPAPDLDMRERIVGAVDMGAYEHSDTDCNGNTVDDSLDIAWGTSQDCNANGIPDECDVTNCPYGDLTCQDCNHNGVPDACDLASGLMHDCHGDGTPEECLEDVGDRDCNRNCVPDSEDITNLTSMDLNGDGIPDECEHAKAGEWDRTEQFATIEGDHATPINVHVEASGDVPGALKRNLQADTAPLPYIWVPATDRGTILRLQTNLDPWPEDEEDVIVGEYLTAPINHDGPQPSRIAVDLDGSLYVANRNVTADGQGSVTKIGVLIGGQRVDADGTPNLDGQYVKDPDYCTCEDRNHDGLIKTSRYSGDVLSWNNYNHHDDDDTVVENAEDECIIRYIRTGGTGSRALAIDKDSNIWAGNHDSNRLHARFDGFTGLPAATPTPNHFDYNDGGYGALIDCYGTLWSTSDALSLLRVDTVDPTVHSTIQPSDNGDSYGIGIDNEGNVWISQQLNGNLEKLDSAGQHLLACGNQTLNTARGVAVTPADDNVWVAESGTNTVARFYNDGTFRSRVMVTTSNAFPTAFGVDQDKKIWVANGSSAVRIDPDGGQGTPKPGAADHVVPLGEDAGAYAFSNLTGMVTLQTTGMGTWSVVHDGKKRGAEWCKVTWTEWNDQLVPPACAMPSSENLIVEVRAADNNVALAAIPYARVHYVNGAFENLSDIPGCSYIGRYLQIRVRFKGSCPGEDSPILCSLRAIPVVECLKGDLSFDGLVNGWDIQPFVSLLIDPPTVIGPATLCAADTNYDGRVDLEDVYCFVGLLLDHPCTEPCSGGFHDCNGNGVDDIADVLSGSSQDCNKNWVPDECDIASQTSTDWNENGIPDECEPDRNGNGKPDDYDIAQQISADINGNGIPDESEPDCNKNGIPDSLDISQATSLDCNADGIPDECQLDCNDNGVPDDCDIDPNDPDGDEVVWPDCNGNGLPDACDLNFAPPRGSLDCNENGIPDECDIANCPSNDPSCQDCNGNGFPDGCDIAAQISLDENENGIPDECEEENRLGGEFGPPFENSEAYWAAVAEYREWAMQQAWGSNSELSGAEQFQRMVAKLQELGLPLRDPWPR